MTHLDRIVARAAKAPPPPGEPAGKLCLLACSDPALAGLEERLGVASGALVVRAPGPSLAEGGELARAVVSAVLLHDCTEIAVVAHSGCSLVAQDTNGLLEVLRRRGVARGSIPGDVREHFHLQASPRALALKSAAALRATPGMPHDVLVHALLLDDASGELSVVERAENAVRPPPAVGANAIATGPTASFSGPMPESLGIGAGLPPALPVKKPRPPSPEKAEDEAAPSGPPSSERTLNPQLRASVERIRGFFNSDVPELERRKVAFALQQAAQSQATSADLVRTAVRPLLQLGPERYGRVLKELSDIRDAAEALPPSEASALLRRMLVPPRS